MTEDDSIEEAAGLPTRLPAAVSLPGAISSASINAKIDAAIADIPADVSAVEMSVKATRKDGTTTISAALAVKLGDGWAAYGEGATDLHGNDSAEVGVRKVWR